MDNIEGEYWGEILETKPEYANWIRTQTSPNPELKAWLAWAESTVGIEGLLPSGQETLNFGKYAGETYAQLLQLDPGYCECAVKQEQPSPSLALFVEFIVHSNAPRGRKVKAKGKQKSATVNVPCPGGCSEFSQVGSNALCNRLT